VVEPGLHALGIVMVRPMRALPDAVAVLLFQPGLALGTQERLLVLEYVGLTGANAGKFTVATLAKNYTFWSGYFSLRQARKIKRL
jgi:hypothetical protein